MTPQRIQLRRTKGWRMPANTVKVDRTTKWGNPFKVGELTAVWHLSGNPLRREVVRDAFHVIDAAHSIRLFEHAMLRDPEWHHDTWQPGDLKELRGKNLACWCKLGDPCHADVLLELANK